MAQRLRRGEKAKQERLLKALAAYRKAMEISQADVARRLGVSQACIGRLDTARRDLGFMEFWNYLDILHITLPCTVDKITTAIQQGPPDSLKQLSRD